ncbi:MarR family winged helix-turn-helix transcriptional regulator [Clostridium pascui]|uniref:MarR family winged helix-turn-helix transcriptional regulator n=1 Tax=Clostridium pascui TaxID=46609 RepID=UPI0019581A3A|nr:MarR family transcriptional regulator [Clostridium pascui]
MLIYNLINKKISGGKHERESVGKLVSILYRQSHVYINYTLKDLNISSSEYIFMVKLYNNEGISQEELSSLLLIDKAATARALKSLEAKGLLMRQKNLADKRANKVFTTDKGKSYKETIYSALRGWTKLITNDMDENTIDIVLDSLKSMSEKAGSTNYAELFSNGGEVCEKNK